MKNSRPYQGNSFEFYQLVYSRKQDANLIARLHAMDDDMEGHFTNYDAHFNTNSLEELVATGYIHPERSDLVELYDYNSAVLQNLKTQLTTSNHGRVVKCQNCTINDVNTFDHLVPQGEFSEFIVHPLNLLCCCGDCNGRRNNIWRKGGHRTTLNLYLDVLPMSQYLFVTADVGNMSIETNFYLENRSNIDENLFALITSHYRRLNLFKRFSEGCDTVISSLKNIIEPLRSLHNLVETRDIILQSVRKDQIAFGINYWQSILKLELLNNDDFLIDFE